MPYSVHPHVIWKHYSISLMPNQTGTGLCIGFESNTWRSEAFARNVIEWLPEFALPYTEYKDICGANSVDSIIKSSKLIYDSEKYIRRGEFGEIFLHMAMRTIHKTIPAISKIYFKSALNDTVKGFDAVHIVEDNNSIELWLGEVKFYRNIKNAIKSVIHEIKEHIAHKYLRNEFIVITNKLDKETPNYDNIKQLIDHRTSLDSIFSKIRIPVFITYESKLFDTYTKEIEAYITSLQEELKSVAVDFFNSATGIDIIIHLYIFPLKNKSELIKTLHNKLKSLQGI